MEVNLDKHEQAVLIAVIREKRTEIRQDRFGSLSERAMSLAFYTRLLEKLGYKERKQS